MTEQDVKLAINGREDLIPYSGPLPIKGCVIAFDDGRI